MEFTISQYNEMGFTPKLWNGGGDENKSEKAKIKVIVNRNKNKEPFKSFVIDAQKKFPNASGKIPSYKLYNQIQRNITSHTEKYARLMEIDLKTLINDKKSNSQKLRHINSAFGADNNNNTSNNNNNTARRPFISDAQRAENRRKARERTAKKARQEKQSNITKRV
ncbi:hypothetical protein [Aquimarina sp. RZ0]|uniref:hypothetical protein n=1 Tax=Aquimarina sp. RZ0 TaxID=2607730 RepID=UPI0011F219E9|nr:hypothetical protein [Aquimarina sp. RZ0]KAA1242729.1 hypothetical protein F0000_24365 [Aquimarina sp. RZ0]